MSEVVNILGLVDVGVQVSAVVESREISNYPRQEAKHLLGRELRCLGGLLETK